MNKTVALCFNRIFGHGFFTTWLSKRVCSLAFAFYTKDLQAEVYYALQEQDKRNKRLLVKEIDGQVLIWQNFINLVNRDRVLIVDWR